MRWRDIGLTCALWAFYLYLIRWTIQAALAILGFHETGADRVLSQDPHGGSHGSILDTLLIYALVVLMNAAILITWSLYNQLRFRGRERRRFVNAVTAADLAERFGVKVEDVDIWQAKRLIVIHHDKEAAITAVEYADAPHRAAPAVAAASRRESHYDDPAYWPANQYLGRRELDNWVEPEADSAEEYERAK